MNVGSVISGKKVITIEPSATLTELVTCLTENKIGAIVVSSDGKNIAGIVSERDIVRVLSNGLDKLHELKVHNFMTVKVQTCTVETTIAQLMEQMTNFRIRHVPVVDSAELLISIISIGDVVKHHVSEIDTERIALRQYLSS